MFIVTIVPLKRGVFLESLSYFSRISYDIGTIVTVPIRGTSVWGLIIECREASTAKTALRAATFSLKRLPEQKESHAFSETLYATAQDVARIYGAPLSQILYTLIPPAIRNGDVPFQKTHHINMTHAYSAHVLYATHKERATLYRSIVRETFAHSGSIIIVAPSSVEAENLFTTLTPGIEDRSILLTTGSPLSVIKKGYAGLEDYSKTKLVITTPTFSMIERHDITTMILEHTRSSFYRNMARPFIDYRTVLTCHAKHTGRKIIFGDLLHRSEDEHQRRAEIFHTYGEDPKRVDLPGSLTVLPIIKSEEKNTFSIFTPKAREEIHRTLKEKGRVFLFAARRGLAPLISCGDCGYIFRSRESGVPFSLVRVMKGEQEERWFVCYSTGERVPAADICPECHSWRLKERGIGIQQCYDALHGEFPDVPVIVFDHLTARTYKKALFLRDTFYKKRSVIMLGTHMALPYLNTPVNLSCVINMDALLATPTWRLDEENLSLLLSLREITQGDVLVQTRSPETDLFDFARHGTIEQFYSSELSQRKAFSYPPYATFVHFLWHGTDAEVQELEEKIRTLFSEFDISLYQNPHNNPGTRSMNGLIRYTKGTWPNTDITNRIKLLPPTVQVTINPDRII